MVGSVIGVAVVEEGASHQGSQKLVGVGPRAVQRAVAAGRGRLRTRGASVVWPERRVPAMPDHKAAPAVSEHVPDQGHTPEGLRCMQSRLRVVSCAWLTAGKRW